MKRFAILLYLLPLATYAAEENYFPTTEEVYQNCKEAIVLGESGKWKEFQKTLCVSLIDGLIYGRRLSTQTFDFSVGDDLEIREKFKAQLIHSFCFLDQNAYKLHPDLVLAKEFVADIEQVRGSTSSNGYMTADGYAILALNLANRDCTNSKSKAE